MHTPAKPEAKSSSDNRVHVLVVGSGAREHAIAAKLTESAHVNKVTVAPGNAGTLALGKALRASDHPTEVTNEPDLKDTDVERICFYVVANNVSLVVPGGEAALVAGLADALKKIGVMCFGPSQEASKLEASKAFSKKLMRENGIPTSDYAVFTQLDPALAHVRSAYKASRRVVIKASGLALGKGVVVPDSLQEAETALTDMLVHSKFGDASSEVIVEEFVQGEEVSALAFTDGHTVVCMPMAQDHKRIGDGDRGPNTGGMGAYVPAFPTAIARLHGTSESSKLAFQQRVVDQVLQPAVNAMRHTRTPFVGVLYAGLIITPEGEISVLEFNARFGDPETQALVPLLESDLYEVMEACCSGYLDAVNVKFCKEKYACAVVAVAQGYPDAKYERGKTIDLPSQQVLQEAAKECSSSNIFLYIAGAKAENDNDKENVVTSGGRVLTVTGIASSLQTARDAAYHGMSKVKFDGMQFRRDIAHRGLALGKVCKDQDKLTYEAAGVSIDRGNELVEGIKQAVRDTRRPGADAEIGGFGGLFELDKAGLAAVGDLVLVASTDGVGTKLRIALETGLHDHIGQDLVAMSVNDIVVQGAEPLFFLDYYACGRLDVVTAARVVHGVARACTASGCALLGGETAEMPGMYAKEDYDLAGFAVGAVRRAQMLPRVDDMREGDVLFGLPSSGVHSNGFSLVRAIVKRSGLSWSSAVPWAAANGSDSSAATLGAALLAPTRLYVHEVLRVARDGLIKGAAHITGGGLPENVPRVIPSNLTARMYADKWELPAVFRWLRDAGGVPLDDLLRTFNCGMGMVLVTGAEHRDEIRQRLPDAVELGELAPRRENGAQFELVGAF